MGLADCDVLAPGKQADIIMINMDKPCMKPENNIANNLVYSGSPQIVKMTMIAGKILYENGKFNTIDIDEVYTDAAGFMAELR